MADAGPVHRRTAGRPIPAPLGAGAPIHLVRILHEKGCWNATRLQQAARLDDVFIPQVAAAAGDPDVLVVGDLNAYGFEDPVNRLTSKDLVNEIERFVRPQSMPYSYIFGGESGYLDHALASTSLDGQVAGVTAWHNNADEPAVIDYNTDAKPQDVYVNNAYRASDHDPVVVSLNLTPTFANVTSSMSIYRSGLALKLCLRSRRRAATGRPALASGL